MAANDVFPRGLVITQDAASGAGASITFPAIPGITWVLTALAFSLQATAACNGTTGVSVNGVVIGGTVVSVDVPFGTSGSASATWTGKILGAPGAAMTITTAAVGGGAPILSAEAYPI